MQEGLDVTRAQKELSEGFESKHLQTPTCRRRPSHIEKLNNEQSLTHQGLGVARRARRRQTPTVRHQGNTHKSSVRTL